MKLRSLRKIYHISFYCSSHWVCFKPHCLVATRNCPSRSGHVTRVQNKNKYQFVFKWKDIEWLLKNVWSLLTVSSFTSKIPSTNRIENFVQISPKRFLNVYTLADSFEIYRIVPSVCASSSTETATLTNKKPVAVKRYKTYFEWIVVGCWVFCQLTPRSVVKKGMRDRVRHLSFPLWSRWEFLSKGTQLVALFGSYHGSVQESSNACGSAGE